MTLASGLGVLVCLTASNASVVGIAVRADPLAFPKPQNVRVPLQSENGSGETGTAILSAAGTGTSVFISIAGEAPGASQPANLHHGSCGRAENIQYPLHDVRDGRSTSTIALPFERLHFSRLIVNVQDSVKSMHAAKDARDVSCGAIPQA